MHPLIIFLSTSSIADGWKFKISFVDFAASMIESYVETTNPLNFGNSTKFTFASTTIPNVPSDPIIIFVKSKE